MDEPQLQFRVVRFGDGRSVADAKWQDAYGDGSFGFGVPELDGLSLQVRVKPGFEPGYYQRNCTSSFGDSHPALTVKYFTREPDLDLWYRVEVTRVDG